MRLPPGRARAFETAGKQGCDCVAWSRKRRTGFISRQGVYESPVPRPMPDYRTKCPSRIATPTKKRTDFLLKIGMGGKALKWLPAHSNFEERNAPKSKRERPSTLRDWPPCPPIQQNGGRQSRPGVNPFISALTVARCPAIFPGMWPHFGTLCPQVGA